MSGSTRPGRTVLDLGELIAEKLLTPRPATLLGVDFEIRRDFTPAQVLAYHQLAATDEPAAAAMIIGAAAPLVLDKLAPLPMEHKVRVWNRILRIAGVMPRMASDNTDDTDSDAAGGAVGESSASSTA